MNPRDIGPLRLHNQQISANPSRTPAEVVAWLGAVQAQDFAGAKGSLGLRLPEATEADVEQAIADAAIVRTWPMRGTLHFVPAADARWMLALLTPRVISSSARRYQQLELDEATFAKCRKVFARALRGGKILTRPEMLETLEQAKISTQGQRGYHLLARLSMDGLLCFGPQPGKQQTFTLLDEWVPQANDLPRDEALATLASRYFLSHGPATLKDFQGWTGLPAAEARAALAGARPNLISEEMGGETYWLSPNTPAPPRRAAEVYALPGFDEFVLGYKERSAVLDPAYADRIAPGANGVFYPTIVAGGQIVGSWKRTFKRERVVVEAAPFTKLSKAAARGFAQAAECYARFLGLSAEVR